MAEVVVEVIVGKLRNLLVEENTILYGVRGQVQSIVSELISIQRFLQEADEENAKNIQVSEAVNNVMDIAFALEDIVETNIHDQLREQREQDFTKLIKRYGSLSFKGGGKYKVGKQMQDIRSRLTEISEMFNTYAIHAKLDREPQEVKRPERETSAVVGFDDVVNEIVELLLDGRKQCRSVISIVGREGLGKTTLARRVCEHDRIRNSFGSHRAFVNVSQIDSVNKFLFFYIAKEFRDRGGLKQMNEMGLAKNVHSALRNQRYLIILDDICHPRDWDAIQRHFPDANNGSRLLITTRIKHVPLFSDPSIFPYMLRPFRDEECWNLFCKIVFPREDISQACTEELESLGKKIVERCDRLPLAVVEMAAFVLTKPTTPLAWREVLRGLNWDSAPDGGVCMNILAHSYQNLPHYLKPCFLYLCCFPENHWIQADMLVRLWVAEGLVSPGCRLMLEDIAEQRLEELNRRRLLQNVQRRYDGGRILRFQIRHYLLDLCRTKARESCLFHTTQQDSKSSGFCTVRRLALYSGEGKGYTSSEVSSKLRTIAFFPHHILKSVNKVTVFDLLDLEMAKLLRVINLERAGCDMLPEAIGGLFHLRFLGLRYNKFESIPSSVGSLKKLQTLDVRGNPLRGVLPSSVWGIRSMRHLLIDYLCMFPVGGTDKRNLVNLQTLDAALAPGLIRTGLASMRNLRILRADFKEDRDFALTHALDHLPLLRELHLSGDHIPRKALGLSRHEHLEELSLDGVLEDYSDSGNNARRPIYKSKELPQNLCYLCLWSSKLQQDPFKLLGKLPCLKELALYEDAYVGEDLTCSADSFPQLKQLAVNELRNLRRWRLEQGAMPRLDKVQITNCNKLEEVPEQFDTTTDGTFGERRRGYLHWVRQIGGEHVDLEVSVRQTAIKSADDGTIVDHGKRKEQLQEIEGSSHSYATEDDTELPEIKELRKPDPTHQQRAVSFFVPEIQSADADIVAVNEAVNDEERHDRAPTGGNEQQTTEHLDQRQSKTEQRAVSPCEEDQYVNLDGSCWQGNDESVASDEKNLCNVDGWVCLESQRQLISEIRELLRADEARTIGISGVGGSGKTTLLKMIRDELCSERDSGFDAVIAVTSSKYCQHKKKMQKKIGEQIGLSLLESGPSFIESMQAKILHQALSEKKFVLILDGVQAIDWKEIGIPVPNKVDKGKILFATNECKDIENVKILNISRLDEHESLKLLCRNIKDKDLCKDVQLIKKIIEKCEGLPLAIILVGRVLSTKKTTEEWQDVVLKMEQLTKEHRYNEQFVVQFALNFSYDYLRNDTQKSCLLYCSLFPENYNINIGELVQYWFGEGLFNADDIDTAYTTGLTIINELKEAFFLEDGDDKENEVKMHNIVRDLALQLTSNTDKSSHIFLVHSGVGLSHVYDVEKWKDATRISLMLNEMKSLPNKIPRCPKLSTLLVNRNSPLKELPKDLFKHMQALCVLDMSYTKIEELPQDIGLLMKLRFLSLSNTYIKSLPNEVGKLAQLRQLDLSSMSCLTHISQKAISTLSRLQLLNLFNSGQWCIQEAGNKKQGTASIKHLNLLEQLREIKLTLKSSESLLELHHESRVCQTLKALSVEQVGVSSLSGILHNLATLQMLQISELYDLDEIKFGSNELENLEVLSVEHLPQVTFTVAGSSFQKLQRLKIAGCHRFKDLHWISKLPSLQHLELRICYEMTDITTASNVDCKPTEEFSFPMLKTMLLWDLPNLQKISPNSLILPCLESLEVFHCPLLKKLPLMHEGAPKLKYIHGNEEWWNDLEWDDQSVKTRFLGIFCDPRKHKQITDQSGLMGSRH